MKTTALLLLLLFLPLLITPFGPSGKERVRVQILPPFLGNKFLCRGPEKRRYFEEEALL